jgi:hypothetical protein
MVPKIHNKKLLSEIFSPQFIVNVDEKENLQTSAEILSIQKFPSFLITVHRLLRLGCLRQRSVQP